MDRLTVLAVALLLTPGLASAQGSFGADDFGQSGEVFGGINFGGLNLRGVRCYCCTSLGDRNTGSIQCRQNLDPCRKQFFGACAQSYPCRESRGD